MDFSSACRISVAFRSRNWVCPSKDPTTTEFLSPWQTQPYWYLSPWWEPFEDQRVPLTLKQLHDITDPPLYVSVGIRFFSTWQVCLFIADPPLVFCCTPVEWHLANFSTNFCNCPFVTLVVFCLWHHPPHCTCGQNTLASSSRQIHHDSSYFQLLDCCPNCGDMEIGFQMCSYFFHSRYSVYEGQPPFVSFRLSVLWSSSCWWMTKRVWPLCHFVFMCNRKL